MRIVEFEIKKYGPLDNIKRIKPGDFNLFFGKNEKGKTLTIDALIKFLLGKKVKDFKHADRVNEYPSGYLRIVFDSAGEMRLPDDGDLASITKKSQYPISSSDCRNIFIIRNSDLSIPDEARFYTGITDRLVGLRTTDINKIRKNLMDIGSLTPGMGFRDDEKSMRLKDRLSRANTLIERIEKVRERLLAGNYDELELDFYKKNREKANIDAGIILYEDARNRSLYENSTDLLHSLEQNIASLKKMESYKEEDANIWQDSEREIWRIGEEISDLKEKGKLLINDISASKKEAENLKANLNILDRKKYDLDNERLKLKNLKEAANKSDSDLSLRKLLKRVSFLSWLIAFLIIISWFFKPSVYTYIAGIISIVIASVLWIYEIILFLKNSRQSNMLSGILFNLAEKGIKTNNAEDAMTALGQFSEDYERTQINFRRHESDLVTSERHLKEIDEKITEYREISDKNEKNILSIKSKCGITALEEYREILNRKRVKERERDSLVDRLAGMLEVQGRSMGEIITNVKSRIEEMKSYESKGKGIEFNLKSYNEIREKSIRLERELKDMKEKLDLIGIEMTNLEAGANDILLEDNERIYCRTLVDLNEILNRLKDFAEENENRKNALAEAITLVNEIELEEKGRVHELFSPEGAGSIPEIFKEITAGAYSEVIFDPEIECIRVKRNDGKIIDAEKLSGGAYDQLYLAIRLAMGEKILNQEKGFFIMDDPFIKSDIDRITKQINVIKKISQIGWQILYFSCKNEIKDILSKDIERGNVQYYDINWLDN